MRRHRLRRLTTVLITIMIGAVILPAAAAGAGSAGLSPAGRVTLLGYARDTWASFVAMTDPTSGLRADSLEADGTASVQTSTTNIGAYMWSTVVAERLAIIGHAEAVARLDKTIHSLETMERDHTLGADGRPSGQYFNWYNHLTGAVLKIWPPTGEVVDPILSSVDNGWLAAAIHVVASTEPELAARADALYESMDFGFYYRPAVNRIAFHVRPSDGFSPCCYDTIVSESRIASYIGIAQGTLPAKEYFGAWRTFPATCDWSWPETNPIGVSRTYLGVKVFEGAYDYDGFRVVPGWGGSMFEALMPTLFVPEEQWGLKSWAINHPLTVAAQVHHGMVEAGYGYWGFSPSNTPEGGYDAYGVDVYRPRFHHVRAPGQAGSAAVGIHEWRRDPTRVVPRPALGPERRPGQPREAQVGLRDLRPVGVPRQRERPDGYRLERLPVPRPGDHHGRHRERPRQGRAANRVRDE